MYIKDNGVPQSGMPGKKEVKADLSKLVFTVVVWLICVIVILGAGVVSALI